MSSPILITGGTGTLGRHVVRRLVSAGRAVRVLSRHPGEPGPGVELVTGNLSTGEGVDAAVYSVDTVIHCASGPRGDANKARLLVRTASRVGVRHLVYISIVGVERIPFVSAVDRAIFGYYAAKRASELVIAESGLPWTTLRATQFHDLILTAAQGLAKLPVIPVFSGIRSQPVDSDEVAARLVDLALGEPAGLVPDFAGPRIYELGHLAQSYLRAVGLRRVLVPVRLPGQAARALRSGANLAPNHAEGTRTWEAFLDSRRNSS